MAKGFYSNNFIRGPATHAQDFLKILDTQIKPSRGRVLKNDMLTGSLDFKTYYDQLGIQLSGLVPNARAKTGDETRVNHSWRFVRRCESYLSLFLAYFYLFILAANPRPTEDKYNDMMVDSWYFWGPTCTCPKDLPAFDKQNAESWAPVELQGKVGLVKPWFRASNDISTCSNDKWFFLK